MDNFTRHQTQMRGYVEETFGRFFPIQQFEEMARQNMALFQRATSMFQPFGGSGQPTAPEPPPEESPGASLSGEMQELKAKLDLLHRQLEELSRVARSREPA